jgi:kynureninase
MANTKSFTDLLKKALLFDEHDPLKNYVNEFAHPSGQIMYGNSLGLMPRRFPHLMAAETHKWGNLGHEGHFDETTGTPWWKFSQQFESIIAKLIGCDASIPEAVVGNTLSVNNYILLGLFFRKALNESGGKRSKIITIKTFFPSDIKSIESALWLCGIPEEKIKDSIIYVGPNSDGIYDPKLLQYAIEKNRHEAALAFFPAVNYISGQRFDLDTLTTLCHNHGLYCGADLAHGIGNIPLHVSKWGLDFATWCGYKYLNNGPGGVGGLYVREKHINSFKYLLGWWGANEDTRFGALDKYQPAKGARRFLASNDQINNSIGLVAQSELYAKYELTDIFEKHQKISTYLHELLRAIKQIQVITPEPWNERGCQISFKLEGYDPAVILNKLKDKFCYAEKRFDVLRAAPVAYNTYAEVACFTEILSRML